MTRSHRILIATTNSTTTSLPSSSSSVAKSAAAEPPQSAAGESDFVVILAALLCALICVIGLIVVARCSWLRRGNAGSGRSPRKPSANKGLKKKILQSLPKLTYDSSATGAGKGTAVKEDCAICLAEYVDGEEIRVLPQCGHGFHVHCIDTWLGSHSSCPSCRQILVVARCHKCGELPAMSVTGFQATLSAGIHAEARQDRATASSSSNFLP